MPDLPCPAVRWQETKGEIIAIKEKEKGDWKNLTIEEKRACMSLYLFYIFQFDFLASPNYQY